MGNEWNGVTRASATSIQLSFTYRGERCRPKIKLEPTPANLKRAYQHLQAVKESIANGTFDYQVTFPNCPNAHKFGRFTGTNTKLSQYLGTWLESKETEIRSSTFASYERIVNNQIIPEFGNLRLNDINRIDVKRWCQKMDCSVKRIYNITSVFRAALQDAVYDSLIQTNPLYNWQFKRNDAPRQRKDDIDPFSKEELAAILGSLSGQNYNLIEFWRETGLRTSELIALEWSDIDFLNGTVSIWKAKTQDAKKPEPPKTWAGNRTIELTDIAIAALKGQKEYTYLADGQIFHNPNTNKPWQGDKMIRKMWERTLKKAGVRYRYPYQIRHTLASTRIMVATSIGEIMYISRMLGHRDWVFTAKTYSRFIKDDFLNHQQASVQK